MNIFNKLFKKNEFVVEFYVKSREAAVISIQEIMDMIELLGIKSQKYIRFYHNDENSKLVFVFKNKKDREEFMNYAEKYVDYIGTVTYRCFA